MNRQTLKINEKRCDLCEYRYDVICEHEKSNYRIITINTEKVESLLDSPNWCPK